jgi:8-oxo-dGTP diphosphatase
MLTADSVVLTESNGKLCVLLVRRNHQPYRGFWALPGGFVNLDEQASDAAKRELAEETGLKQVRLKPIGFFDTPGRDPRGWTVSVVHLGFVSAAKLKQLQAGDDAAQVALYPLRTRIKLAFDHADIIRYAARWWKKNQE